MMKHSSVLVLDDGELENVHEMLLALETDVTRLNGRQIGLSVPAPLDLLISAGRRTLLEMPELVLSQDASERPVWVCVHNQDYLPLREKLSEMGVHYLLQSALDEQSRRRFLIQLLRKGVEQRGALRLHLGGEIKVRTDSETTPVTQAMLVDLSLEGCRILTQEEFDPGTSLTALLSAALGGGEELALTGTVVRTGDRESRGGRDYRPAVIQFDELDDADREQLDGIVRGERIGTKITPLASLPDDANCRGEDEPDERDGQDDPEAASGVNRRMEVRHGYAGRAKIIGLETPGAKSVLACDLSLCGVRLSGCEGVEKGNQLTIALFGSARDEPTVLEATVVRASSGGEVALAFDQISAKEHGALEKLLHSQPELDALQQPDSDAGRTLVAEIRTTASS